MKKLILILLVLLGLQTQAQINYCDSVSYSTLSNGGNLIVQGDSINQIPGTVSWTWLVCNTNLCFSDTGITAIFNQVTTSDTLKVCYDLFISINGWMYTCTSCDSLVYDPNQYNWVPMMANPLAIKEIKNNYILDNKMYDLFGREIFEVPFGKMYIRNNKKCIRIK